MKLHIMHYNKKFIKSYIKFIKNNFDFKKHFFIIEGIPQKNDKNFFKKHSNVEVIEDIFLNFETLKMIVKMNDKSLNSIYLHGLFNYRLILILFLQAWLLKKCNWIIWGADLYYYKNRKRKWRNDIYEYFRKKVINKFGGFITHIKGDYELAKKWYNVKGEYYYSFMYLSNLYKDYKLSKKKKKDNKLVIQVGNSANSTNEHLEVFEKLKKYKENNLEIICPLSYGDEKYAKKIVKKGNEIFGEQFKPLTDFLPLKEYLSILAKVDIAIFNHRRQQAVGNIITLLGLGKKVYIRDDITTWQFAQEHNLKVYSTNKLLNNDFSVEIPEKLRSKNISNVKKYFSYNKLKKDWEKIFHNKE